MAFKGGWQRIETIVWWAASIVSVGAIATFVVEYSQTVYRICGLTFRLNELNRQAGERLYFEGSFIELLFRALERGFKVEYAFLMTAVIAVVWCIYFSAKVIGWVVMGFIGDKEETKE